MIILTINHINYLWLREVRSFMHTARKQLFIVGLFFSAYFFSSWNSNCYLICLSNLFDNKEYINVSVDDLESLIQSVLAIHIATFNCDANITLVSSYLLLIYNLATGIAHVLPNPIQTHLAGSVWNVYFPSVGKARVNDLRGEIERTQMLQESSKAGDRSEEELQERMNRDKEKLTFEFRFFLREFFNRCNFLIYNSFKNKNLI